MIVADGVSYGKGGALDTKRRRELPGNDASWYRALLNDNPTEVSDRNGDSEPPVIPPPGGPVESKVDTPPPAAPAPATDPVDTPDPPPTAEPEGTVSPARPPTNAGSDSSVAPVTPAATPAPSNQDTMVGRLWESTAEQDALTDWKPEDLPHVIASKRSFRWPTVVLIIGALAVVVVGFLWLPSVTRARATDQRDLYQNTLMSLRRELPKAQTSLAVATDPTSTVAAMADRATELTAWAAAASEVDAVSSRALPAAAPLTSSAAIDHLEPIRQSLEPLATVAASIQARISRVIEYRTLMAGFLDLPDLPVAADDTEMSTLRVRLAAAQADAISVLSDLPDDPAFDEHRVQARKLADRFGDWQVEYLEALRTTDPTAAQALLTELDTARTGLLESIIGPLSEVRQQVDADIIDLATRVDAILVTLAAG